MKKIIYTVIFLMLTILTSAVVHKNGKAKKQKQVIPCAPAKQAEVKVIVKANTHSLLPSPMLL